MICEFSIAHKQHKQFDSGGNLTLKGRVERFLPVSISINEHHFGVANNHRIFELRELYISYIGLTKVHQVKDGLPVLFKYNCSECAWSQIPPRECALFHRSKNCLRDPRDSTGIKHLICNIYEGNRKPV